MARAPMVAPTIAAVERGARPGGWESGGTPGVVLGREGVEEGDAVVLVEPVELVGG